MGANDESKPGSEASLDVQVSTVINWPLQNTYYYYNEPDGGFEQALQAVLDKGIKPGVLSVSWGLVESQVGSSQNQHMCKTIQQLTAQGTTVVFASGDSGVQGVQYQGTSCANGFEPTAPSGCPYVLSVGATKNPSKGQEVATLWGGGGFSNEFKTPDYQKTAVKTYLGELGNKNQGKFKKDGRAFPDVSAMGQSIVSILSIQVHPYDLLADCIGPTR